MRRFRWLLLNRIAPFPLLLICLAAGALANAQDGWAPPLEPPGGYCPDCSRAESLWPHEMAERSNATPSDQGLVSQLPSFFPCGHVVTDKVDKPIQKALRSGLKSMKHGEFPLAQRTFKRLTQEYPGFADGWYLLGTALQGAGPNRRSCHRIPKVSQY